MKSFVKVTKLNQVQEEFDFSGLVKIEKIVPVPEIKIEPEIELPKIEEIAPAVEVLPPFIRSEPLAKPVQSPKAKKPSDPSSHLRGEPPEGFTWHLDYARALSPIPPANLDKACEYLNKWHFQGCFMPKKAEIIGGSLTVYFISDEEIERFKKRFPEGYYSFPTVYVLKTFAEVQK